MALTREQKQKILEDLKEKIARQKAMIFVDFTGLKVKDLSDLRKRLKTTDNELKVVKKTLLNSVLKEKGFKTEVKELKGEIAVVFGFREGLSPSKIIYQFGEENPNLKILGGFFENKLREAEEIITLAQLPSKEELLAKLTGTIFAPVSNLVNVLQGNIKGLIYALSGIKK
jgi:large subunit ribosomal protein L10